MTRQKMYPFQHCWVDGRVSSPHLGDLYPPWQNSKSEMRNAKKKFKILIVDFVGGDLLHHGDHQGGPGGDGSKPCVRIEP